MKPFLKWAGGKHKIVDRILNHLPLGRRLIEPFAGSCAVSLATNYREYIIADVNRDLISLYKILAAEGVEFIDYCEALFTEENNQEDRYYFLREEFNTTTDVYRKAALFIYLNRHGYNGLCRYNSSGRFNVPFGRYKSPYFPRKEMMYFWESRDGKLFLCCDFEQAMRQARAGDVIYCDPPYVPLTPTASFTDYASVGFSLDDQRRLANLALELSQNGITVVISNHDTAITAEMYAAATRVERFSVRRFISCDVSKRYNAAELLAVFRNKGDGNKGNIGERSYFVTETICL